MKLVISIIMAIILDLILGDPQFLTHPVIIMGRCISKLEKILRRIFPDTEKGQLFAGLCLAIIMPVGTYAFFYIILLLLNQMHWILAFIFETFWCYQAIAIRDMIKESRGVYTAVTTGSIRDARQAVSRIVGRDTSVLDRKGVIKAAVETVAENFSDGVMAPLLYMAIGGAPLALAYKSVNTMDSMVGYKNDKYLYFGRCAARLDDIAGFIPSRLSAIILILASLFCGKNAKNAFKIWIRDRYNHASPNSAQTEAVMAGALEVQLAGPAVYFGKKYDKPFIGDDIKEIVDTNILDANRIFVVGSLMAGGLLCVIRTAVIILL